MLPGWCCIANRHIGARERRQLIPHVRFQVPFLGPESQVKSGFACAVFFFPPVWPIRTRHGPYNSVSGEKHLEKGHVWSRNVGKSSHRHKQKTKQKTQPKRPANPPARFAFRQKANSEATKNGAGPKQEPNQTI